MLRFTVLLSLATTRLSWRSASLLPATLLTLSPALRVLSCGAPLDEGGDYFVVTRWVDEASHDAYAAARRERDPNTVVSHADGTMSFEKVEFDD